jgi:hypothetical protein
MKSQDVFMTIERSELEEWRSSLHFFESGLRHLMARRAEIMMTQPRECMEDGVCGNADLMAMAAQGVENARRNIARIERISGGT